MRRGEIWWANLPSPVGKRPVILLSRDKAYEVRNAVTVAEVTTTIRNIPVEVRLTKADGMPKECVVNLDTIITIPKNLVVEYITILNIKKIEEINEAIRFALDISK